MFFIVNIQFLHNNKGKDRKPSRAVDYAERRLHASFPIGRSIFLGQLASHRLFAAYLAAEIFTTLKYVKIRQSAERKTRNLHRLRANARGGASTVHLRPMIGPLWSGF